MRAKAVYKIERLEEGIYLVVAVLLAVAAILLLVSADAMQGALDPYAIVLTVLDKGLVLLMVAEFLHTLRVTVRERVPPSRSSSWASSPGSGGSSS